jgi:hypothetical protein
MGLIKNVVGALLGFIKALLGVFLGIFGLGKKSEYFLEIDDSAPSVAPTPEPVAVPQSDVAVSSPASLEPAAVEKVPENVAVAVAPGPVPTPQSPESKGSEDGEMTFATDFLVNPRLTNTSRRRPGPSLSPFTNMVKDMKRSASMG